MPTSPTIPLDTGGGDSPGFQSGNMAAYTSPSGGATLSRPGVALVPDGGGPGAVMVGDNNDAVGFFGSTPSPMVTVAGAPWIGDSPVNAATNLAAAVAALRAVNIAVPGPLAAPVGAVYSQAELQAIQAEADAMILAAQAACSGEIAFLFGEVDNANARNNNLAAAYNALATMHNALAARLNDHVALIEERIAVLTRYGLAAFPIA